MDKNYIVSQTEAFVLPKDATIIGFADHLADIIVSKQSQNFEVYANESITSIKTWLAIVELDLPE